MNIRHKLYLMTGALVLMFAGIAGVSYWGISRIEQNVHHMTDVTLPATSYMGMMNDALKVHRIRTATHIMSTTDEDRTYNAARIAKQIAQFNEYLARYQPMAQPGEEQDNVQNIVRLWGEYVSTGNIVLAASTAGNEAEARRLFMDRSLALYSEISDVIDANLALQMANGERISNTIRQTV